MARQKTVRLTADSSRWVHTKIRPPEKLSLGRADRYKQVCLNS